MTDSISARHEGDLGGTFLPFGDVTRAGVTVVVAPEWADTPAVQHTAWMLVNLLCRQTGVLHSVGLACPRGVPLDGRVVPLANRSADLCTALLEGANSIGGVCVQPNLASDRTIVVGPSGPPSADMYVVGSAWSGGFSTTSFPVATSTLESGLAFGPYAAACLAAGEVFKAVRMVPGSYITPMAAFYDAWTHSTGSSLAQNGPESINVDVDALLVGVGAVGSACVHALWATPHIGGRLMLVDGDSKGVEVTNLNRYTLFGGSSLGSMKASEASRIASDAAITWDPYDVPFELLPGTLPRRVVSAVDKNTARAAIQNRYAPRIFSASTLDLRAEVLRCGPPGIGACLRCFNAPEQAESDDEVRARLRSAPHEQTSELATLAGVTLADAQEWIGSGKCGIAGERLLQHVRRSPGSNRFAVGFVSAFAGTLAAAELIKDHMGPQTCLSPDKPRATFQFHDLLARSNRASSFGRDPHCPMCVPSSVACEFWMERYASLESETLSLSI